MEGGVSVLSVQGVAPGSLGVFRSGFEEAVSAYFAAYYMRVKHNQPAWRSNGPTYERAMAVIKSRLDADIHCVRQ